MNMTPKSTALDVRVEGFFDEDSFRMMHRLLKGYGSVRLMSFDAQSKAPVTKATFMVLTVHDAAAIKALLQQVSRNSEVTVEENHAPKR